MSSIERMKDQLVTWGLIPQVWELRDAGFALVEAIAIVYKAHIQNAYTASRYA